MKVKCKIGEIKAVVHGQLLRLKLAWCFYKYKVMIEDENTQVSKFLYEMIKFRGF